jgi:hypothetical protein
MNGTQVAMIFGLQSRVRKYRRAGSLRVRDFLLSTAAYLQLNVAAGNVFPRTVPLFLTLAELAVAFTQVAVIVFAICAEMFVRLTSFGSDVDHVPMESGVMGHTPETLDETENVTWFPGAAAV